MTLPRFILKENANSRMWHIFQREDSVDSEGDEVFYYHVPMCGRQYGLYYHYWELIELDADTDMNRNLCKKCKERYRTCMTRELRLQLAAL